MAAKNYYLVLGVSRQESARGIQEAFRSLAKRYHPDRTGPQGTAAFQDIVEAYQVLSDPARRGLYNQSLRHAEGTSHVTPETSAPPFGPAPEPLVPEPIPGLQGVRALHPAFASFEGLDVGILLSAQEAMTGGTLAVTIPVYYPCAACQGAGRTWSYVCSSCHGQGLLQEPETLRVSIPSMVQDGTLLEVPVRGLGIHNFSVRLHLRVV